MRPHHPTIPPAPQPTKTPFDPFNSSSTGHQRAENRLSGSTSWRDVRTEKLKGQFSDVSGRGGRERVEGLEIVDGTKIRKMMPNGKMPDWDKMDHRDGSEQDIRKLFKTGGKGVEKKRKATTFDINEGRDAKRLHCMSLATCKDDDDNNDQPATTTEPSSSSSPIPPRPPQIFTSLTLYLAGSTAPLISDHKLKHLFTQHGGSISLGLARRKVTHVIIGESLSGGGGLAARKMQKEISTVRGKGIRFVTASWVVESVERGVRLMEGGFVPDSIAGRIGGFGQKSVGAWVETAGPKTRMTDNEDGSGKDDDNL